MKRCILAVPLLLLAMRLLTGLGLVPAQEAEQPPQTDPGPARVPATHVERPISPFLKSYCATCHHGEDAAAELSLDALDPHIGDGEDLEIWRMIREQVRYGNMPPPEAAQPTAAERDAFLAELRQEFLKTQQPGQHARHASLSLPRYGNDVDHAALFDDPAGPVIPGPPRVWRLRPLIYQRLVVGDLRPTDTQTLSDPLNLERGSEFKDYAARYFIDEPATSLLLANAEKLVEIRSRAVFATLTATDQPPSPRTVATAIEQTFREILCRAPTPVESARFARLYDGIHQTSGPRLAAQRLLMAVYMQPGALFREELGAGPPDALGRIRLSPHEIALAVSYALGNQPDQLLLEAAGQGTLATPEQVAAHLRRRLDAPPEQAANPRVAQFFREYFNYPHAEAVFKNQPTRGAHLPRVLITDLELLIDEIVRRDQDVLYQLLTTDQYFVDCQRDPRTNALRQSTSDPRHQEQLSSTSNPEYATLYGLSRDWIWTARQPITVPGRVRAGVLTHPAWLVAWSGNFDNHPVQRGKWIRTHLLGGTVPDVPISVDATVPADRSKQFRERLTIATAGAKCQRCHRKMDPLGMPFEQYDHYGRFRRRELGRPIDTSGAITLVEDETLVGDVANPMEMLHRLATSEHVEQVFVRHVFRYFMGRNETLGDARTLRAAHQAYRQQGGSFRALVTSLLISDSFLYRAKVADAQST